MQTLRCVIFAVGVFFLEEPRRKCKWILGWASLCASEGSAGALLGGWKFLPLVDWRQSKGFWNISGNYPRPGFAYRAGQSSLIY